MEKRIPAETTEKVVDDMTANKDPQPIVNYTVGMIVVFIGLLLVAAIALGIYFASSGSRSDGGANQSETRAQP